MCTISLHRPCTMGCSIRICKNHPHNGKTCLYSEGLYTTISEDKMSCTTTICKDAVRQQFLEENTSTRNTEPLSRKPRATWSHLRKILNLMFWGVGACDLNRKKLSGRMMCFLANEEPFEKSNHVQRIKKSRGVRDEIITGHVYGGKSYSEDEP